MQLRPISSTIGTFCARAMREPSQTASAAVKTTAVMVIKLPLLAPRLKAAPLFVVSVKRRKPSIKGWELCICKLLSAQALLSLSNVNVAAAMTSAMPIEVAQALLVQA